jgi:tyrosyl-tRNA synthetase
MLQGGGVSLNRQKLSDVELTIGSANLINDKYLIAQRGKKNYFLIIVE